MDHNFKKVWLNEEHTEYRLEYWAYGKFNTIVTDDSQILLAWLAEGNTLEEVEYVAPPPTPPIANWDDFRDDLAESRFYGLMLANPIPSILSSQLVDALRQQNIEYVRRVAEPIATILSLEQADKDEVNTMASNHNVEDLFV